MTTIKIEMTENLDRITAGLDNTESAIRSKGGKVFRAFVSDIFADTTLRSPVDNNMYKSSWEMNPIKGSSGVVSAYKVSNPMVYSPVMETGSKPGKPPWPSPTRPKDPEGKTIKVEGRIWSTKMPEPVLGGAIESADFEGLKAQLIQIFKEAL